MVMVIVDHGYGYGYHGPCLWLWLCLCCISSLSFNVGFWYELIPYLSNQVLIKLDQLKLLIAVSQSAFP
jgi:hypothetical protein